MSAKNVDAMLADFHETNATVRLVWGIFEAIPGAPSVSFYQSVLEAQRLVVPELPPEGLAMAVAYANSAESAAALKVADMIDTGDVGISVYTGVRSALTFFFGDRSKAMETDPQQGADAALKALAIAYMAHTLFPGSVSEKVRQLRAVPAGEALLTYFAAVELALPFADDALLTSGSIITGLLQKYGGSLGKLDMAAGAGASAAAQGMLGGLAAPLDGIVRSVAQQTTQIAGAAQKFLPSAIATAGTIAGAAATAADALPVYRYLTARLVAEAALYRAAGK